MKLKTKIILIAIAAVVVIGAVVGCILLFGGEDKPDDSVQANADGIDEMRVDTKYLSSFEEDTTFYYLQKVPSNIAFEVKSDKKASFSIVDENGSFVDAIVEKSSDETYIITPPTDGYTEGKTYTLTLDSDVFFCDSNLKNARKLMFTVERNAVEKYELAENVLEADATITEIDENTISVVGLDVKVGDIIFGKNDDGEYVAYKIESISADGTASVSLPALDEVYTELNVYGEYEFDPSGLVANPDIEAEIVDNVKQSSFYSALITTVYAAGEEKDASFKVSFDVDEKNNTVEITVKITLEPGESGLFGDVSLRDHYLTITKKDKLHVSMLCDIDSITDWDLCASVYSESSQSIELTYKTGENETLNEYLTSSSKEKLQKIADALNDASSDLLEGTVKLFDLDIATPVPGLYFGTEVKVALKFDVAASIVVSHSNMTTYNVGVKFKDMKFDVYSNANCLNDSVEMSLRGKVGAKLGLSIAIKATILCDGVAYVEFAPEAGAYLDIYAAYPIKSSDDNVENASYCYFEPGFYFGADINAMINVGIKKFEFTYELIEEKFPNKDLTLGSSKIYSEIEVENETVSADDGEVLLPAIFVEYYDVKSCSVKHEEISYDDVTITIPDGIDYNISNGKLVLPSDLDCDSFNVAISYKHDNGEMFETELCVEIGAPVIDSGKCGDNLTWTFDEDGVLTIDGTGDMWDFEVTFDDYGIEIEECNIPWYLYVTENTAQCFITSVSINEGVTSIGNWAFADCESLTSITIPDSVTFIGWGAFSGCINLTEITVPGGVSTIRGITFWGCENLTSITIPDSVTYIELMAFYGCSGLTSITLPDSLTYIDDYAFYGCENLTSITIPDSVTYIGSAAFSECSSLTSIALPDSLTYINAFAFCCCSSLTSIEIPDSVTSIENNAFDGCDSLTEVDYGGSYLEWFSIEIGSGNSVLDNVSVNCEGEDLFPDGIPYDKILAYGDGYYLVSNWVETYNEAYWEYGIFNESGDWLVPLSNVNEIALCVEYGFSSYAESYYDLKFDYVNEGMFIVRRQCCIFPETIDFYNYAEEYIAHGGCFVVNAQTGQATEAGAFITKYYDGYCFYIASRQGKTIRIDKNGNKTEVLSRGGKIPMGEPSCGLILIDKIFYDIHTLEASIDLNEYDISDFGTRKFDDNGEYYFEFRNPAGTIYYATINLKGEFITEPQKLY